MSEVSDEDLHDVFRILYADEDDWGMLDEEEHPPLDSLVPDIDPDAIDLSSAGEEDDYTTRTYTLKRFRSEIDSLLIPSHTKKRRIFPHPSHSLTPSTGGTGRYIPSRSPIPPLPSTTSFEPFSPLALLGRLRTFHPSTFSPSYPSSISPRVLASNGWCSSGKDGLECGSCHARWGVGGLDEIPDQRVREEIAKRLAGTLASRHRGGCGWSIVSCPHNLLDRLRTLLHPPLASNLASLALRLASSPNINTLHLRSPLVEKQTNHLVYAMTKHLDPPSSISTQAAQLALFGWAPHDLSSDILGCRICQRRIGLWAFDNGQEAGEGGRALDPVEEHLGWCPIRLETWWDKCPLLSGKRASAKDLRVSQGVQRRKWIK